MALTLRQLAIFTAVADTGSTTGAGLRVSLSQSATSSALNELENLLGARLFDRIGKRLVLNDSGRALLPRARALLDGASGIERDFRVTSAAGATRAADFAPAPADLRVAASTTIGNYLLPPLVAEYCREWPNVRIDVEIANTHDVSVSVGRFAVDMGLIEGPCHEPDVQVLPWIEDELVIVGSPQHPLLRQEAGQRQNLKALRATPWLLREPGSGTREAVEQALLPHLHQLQQEIHFGSTEAIKHAAAAGLGLTCLSLSAVRDLLTLGRLQIVATTLPRLLRRFYIVHHRHKQFSASLTRFLEHCRAGASVRQSP